MRIILFIVILLTCVSSLCFSIEVYPENGYYESTFPEKIQKYINKIADRKCSNSDYITGFHEDPVEIKDGKTFYTVEIVLHDYEGSGWITVVASEDGQISLYNLDCPNFFH